MPKHRLRHEGKLQVRTDETCRIELSRIEVGAGYPGAFEIGPGQTGTAQVGPNQICSLQIGVREIGVPQECMVELYPPQRHAGKIASHKVGSTEIGARPLLPARLKIDTVLA